MPSSLQGHHSVAGLTVSALVGMRCIFSRRADWVVTAYHSLALENVAVASERYLACSRSEKAVFAAVDQG